MGLTAHQPLTAPTPGIHRPHRWDAYSENTLSGTYFLYNIAALPSRKRHLATAVKIEEPWTSRRSQLSYRKARRHLPATLQCRLNVQLNA